MAWGEVKVMCQKKNFIIDCQSNILTFSEICRRYEISRKTGYKWLNRFQLDSVNGLNDLSRAPKTQAKVTDPDLVKQILNLKLLRKTWGPKKILAELVKNNSDWDWPSATTIGNILDKHGLVIRRKYRKRFPKINRDLINAEHSNDVWCMDFKGWSLTKEGLKFEPFTLTDQRTRFLLRCLKLSENNTEHVWGVLDLAFREYGLPLYLLSDNGPPFAANTAGRISRLSVKLIKAGVTPQWIEPGNPQQNGQHERMHRTMKEECIIPYLLTLEEQKMKLREFQEYFNFQRPHEALGQKYPSEEYRSSPRIWNGKLNPIEYSPEYKIGKVRLGGKMCWKGVDVFISRSLEGEHVGIKENDKNDLEVYFGPIKLGILDNHELNFERNPSRKKLIRS
jgi:transposase InsO family protein